ncbi:MAG: LysR family transcriptional regulator [Ruminococcus sp.]|jgi:DNA-binding transcriptional LysR family regulator|nr:LysR family transcriptional regulator [Ruminococcus sp.]
MISESNLNRYRLFCAVAEAGSISAAAERNFISQPAISKAISKMEDTLSTALFFRNHNGVSLTPEGEMLYEELKTAFDIIKSGEDRLKVINEKGIGHLRLGASGVLAKNVLLPYLKRYTAENPHVNITIECKSSSQIARILSDGGIDIALMVKPITVSDIECKVIGQIHDAFVCTKEYRDNLNKTHSPVRFWNDANIMLMDTSNASRIHIEKYFKDEGITPQKILEVTTMDMLIEFAKVGIGVACVIEEFVQSELQSGELIKIPLSIPVPGRDIMFATAKYAKITNSMQKFINLYNKPL